MFSSFYSHFPSLVLHTDACLPAAEPPALSCPALSCLVLPCAVLSCCPPTRRYLNTVLHCTCTIPVTHKSTTNLLALALALLPARWVCTPSHPHRKCLRYDTPPIPLPLLSFLFFLFVSCSLPRSIAHLLAHSLTPYLSVFICSISRQSTKINNKKDNCRKHTLSSCPHFTAICMPPPPLSRPLSPPIDKRICPHPLSPAASPAVAIHPHNTPPPSSHSGTSVCPPPFHPIHHIQQHKQQQQEQQQQQKQQQQHHISSFPLPHLQKTPSPSPPPLPSSSSVSSDYPSHRSPPPAPSRPSPPVLSAMSILTPNALAHYANAPHDARSTHSSAPAPTSVPSPSVHTTTTATIPTNPRSTSPGVPDIPVIDKMPDKPSPPFFPFSPSPSHLYVPGASSRTGPPRRSSSPCLQTHPSRLPHVKPTGVSAPPSPSHSSPSDPTAPSDPPAQSVPSHPSSFLRPRAYTSDNLGPRTPSAPCETPVVVPGTATPSIPFSATMPRTPSEPPRPHRRAKHDSSRIRSDRGAGAFTTIRHGRVQSFSQATVFTEEHSNYSMQSMQSCPNARDLDASSRLTKLHPRGMYGEFGSPSQWALDIFTLPHNAIRAEFMDLSSVLESVEVRLSCIRSYEIEELYFWWTVFEMFLVEYFDFEADILFPWVFQELRPPDRTSTETGDCIEGVRDEMGLKESLLESKESLLHSLRQLNGTFELRRHLDVTELFPMILKEMNVFIPMLTDYFNKEEELLPPIVFRSRNRSSRDRLTRTYVQYIKRGESPRMHLTLLTRWMDVEKRKKWVRANIGGLSRILHWRRDRVCYRRHMYIPDRFQRRLQRFESCPENAGHRRSVGSMDDLSFTSHDESIRSLRTIGRGRRASKR